MADDIVMYEVADRVALITWNRPDRMNSWTTALEDAYFDALVRAGGDPEVNVIVVTGAGRGFCPGADMAFLQGMESDGDDNLTDTGRRPVPAPLGTRTPITGAHHGAGAGAVQRGVGEGG